MALLVSLIYLTAAGLLLSQEPIAITHMPSRMGSFRVLRASQDSILAFGAGSVTIGPINVNTLDAALGTPYKLFVDGLVGWDPDGPGAGNPLPLGQIKVGYEDLGPGAANPSKLFYAVYAPGSVP